MVKQTDTARTAVYTPMIQNNTLGCAKFSVAHDFVTNHCVAQALINVRLVYKANIVGV